MRPVELALFVARGPEGPAVSLATSEGAPAAPHATVANAIYSAVGDAHTCPACAAADGTETADPASAAAWAPNPRCTSPKGCRCLVFFEHERLDPGEEGAFVAFAAARGLGVTASAVAAFHADVRERREQAAQRCSAAAGLLRAAAGFEKPEPEQAVALYRKAIESLLACSPAPLDERAVSATCPSPSTASRWCSRAWAATTRPSTSSNARPLWGYRACRLRTQVRPRRPAQPRSAPARARQGGGYRLSPKPVRRRAAGRLDLCDARSRRALPARRRAAGRLERRDAARQRTGVPARILVP